VTKFFPTIITGSEERMVGALRNLTSAVRELERNNQPESYAVAGYHIEGPHLSPEDGPRGAHPLEYIRPPDIEEFHRWQEAADGMVKLVTVSPEWDGMPSYVSEVVRTGVVASIGHTKASTEQIQAVVDAGARMSTHLGNAAHPTLPKTQNYIWDQLAISKLTPSFIVDGIHIPPHFIQACMRAKSLENCVLVTDAVAPAMCAPGAYRLGQVDVELRADGSVVMLGGNRLAGSALRMDQAIANTVRYAEITLREAVMMATQNAARMGRLSGRQRGVVPGEKADLVRFSWAADKLILSVKETVVAGTSVYKA
jgi:N-acetylglucosamine-6-phosphate deacetylase